MSKGILLCEDDVEMSGLLTDILKKKGYEVHQLYSCEGLAAEVAIRNPDLILMDLIMPEAGGLDATINLRSKPETCNVKVILMSGHQKIAGFARSARAQAYLMKPFSMKQLWAVIHHVLLPQQTAV